MKHKPITTRHADDDEEQTDGDHDKRTHRRGWGDAAAHGRICRAPSCHSRDDVRPTTTHGEDEEPMILCGYCRRMHFEVSS